jgi:hypothetical protein
VTGFVDKYVDSAGLFSKTKAKIFYRFQTKFTTITKGIVWQSKIEMGILSGGDSHATILRVTAKPPYDLCGGRRIVYFLCYTTFNKRKRRGQGWYLR